MARTAQLAVWLRFALFLVLLIAGLAAVWTRGVPDIRQVQDSLDGLGGLGLAAFVVVYGLYTLLLLPKGVMSAAAGLLYGLGAMLGAIAAFWLGRALGRDAVEQLGGSHLAAFERQINRHGILAVIFVRLVPIIPFTAINYGSGLTALTHRSYVLGTAIGIIPGSVAYVALGAYGTDPTSWRFAAALTTFLLLTVAGALVVRAQRRGSDPTIGSGNSDWPGTPDRPVSDPTSATTPQEA